MAEHAYGPEFYTYLEQGSRASARAVATVLLPELRIESLLDIGAGHGSWAAEWLAAGVPDVVAVDGDYVQREQLVIPADRFVAHDLTAPIDLGRRFDLVQSLEVAEHLPARVAKQFIESLTRHGDVVLFSAAVPNQGGEHHVNEQPPEYWRRLFATQGYEVFDWVRPHLAGKREVRAWYRYNSFLYANAAGERRLSDAIRAAKVASDVALTTDGNLAWAVRRLLVGLMPEALVKPAAMLKSNIEARLRGPNRLRT